MKKFVKALSLILAVAMIFVIAGCKGADEDTNTTGTSANSIYKDIKVGVIHIGNPADGSGYSYAHDQGIIAAQQALGLSDNQMIRKINISDSDAAASKTAMEECVEEGCNIIFATSWGYGPTALELAKEYPDVMFSHGTGVDPETDNSNNYFGRIYQARYLAGIAAGLKTASDKVGFVAAWGTDNSEVTGGLDAFAKGVAAVNKDAKIYVKVTNSWFTVDGEKQAAEALIDLGCDVIGQHCDTTAPQLAAQEAGVFGCGYNSDMTPAAPEAHLTAPIWNWGVYYTKAVEAAAKGTFKDFGNYFGGMEDGFVDISPLSENCAEGTKDIIDQVKALIIDGTFAVFDGKQVSVGEDNKVTLVDEAIMDNAGKTVVAAGGECLDDPTIRSGINWYYSNVAGVSDIG
ncbi:MAG: BMP family ABC transporter substrate-binding protein [Clostridiales bacterium]|nr:BMP family ABC transporter substrate-binding protein [Clostridiales bacterium]